MRLDKRAQLAPRHLLLHFFQEYRSPRLLCVPLKTSHHRQCPLLFVRRCHPGETYSILPVERENLIRVSLKPKFSGRLIAALKRCATQKAKGSRHLQSEGATTTTMLRSRLRSTGSALRWSRGGRKPRSRFWRGRWRFLTTRLVRFL